MSWCECKTYPHEDWCDNHPHNAKVEELQEQTDALSEKVQQLERKLEVAVGALMDIQRDGGIFSTVRAGGALKEIEGMK